MDAQPTELLFAESRRIKGIFEAMTDGIMVVDCNGNLLLYNKVVEELFFPDRQPNYALTTYLSTLIKQGTSDGQAEVVLFKPHAVVLSNRYVVIRDTEGRPEGFVVSIRNVTERRNLDRRFSQFFAIMLRKEARLLRRARRAKKAIERRKIMHRLTNLSKNLVSLTQLRGGPLRIDKDPFNLIDLYEKAKAKYVPHFTKVGIKFQDDGMQETSPIPIRGHKNLFLQVFSTLFAKARHSLPKGGEMSFARTVEDGRVKLFVHFQGKGVNERINALSHDWSNQIDCVINGDSEILDLELAFICHIVQAHKGSIQFSNESDDNAVVQIDIPLDEESLTPPLGKEV
ncbi:MAG: hypothetical protein WA705_24250 [Candidatus Ozemobacteraceae bacterium]